MQLFSLHSRTRKSPVCDPIFLRKAAKLDHVNTRRDAGVDNYLGQHY